MWKKLFVVGAAASSYERLLLKFDERCADASDYTLVDYIESRLSKAEESEGVNPTKFRSLLEAELERIREITDLEADREFREQSAVRNGRTLRSVRTPVASRTLGSTPVVQREDEILSALHLLAVSTAAGDDMAAAVLEAERRGDVAKMIEGIQQVNPLGLVEEELEEKLESAAGISPSLLMTNPRSLEFLDGMKIVNNPVLGEKLAKLAELLPCMDLKPAPDTFRLAPEPAGTEIESLEEEAKATSSSTDPIDWSILKKRMKAEKKSGVTEVTPKLKQEVLLSGLAEFASSTKVPWQAVTYAAKGDRFGVGLDSALTALGRSYLLKKDPKLASKSKITVTWSDIQAAVKGLDMTIAIVDGGCANDSDLNKQFWRNTQTPGCKGTAVVGTSAGKDKDWPRNCIGYDFGNDNGNPTTELTSRHGTAVSGCAGAQPNTSNPAIGVCPWCKIACLKVADSQGKIYLSYTLKAIDYILAKKFKISNHSMGSYGYREVSSYEDKAFLSLSRAGVFVAASAGNDACSTEEESSSACKSKWQIHLPSGLLHPGQISVGATDSSGKMSTFSNYGPTSVDVFAPGTNIKTIGLSSTVVSVNGTSFSSPIVAGIAGVIRSVYPGLTHVQVKEAIVQSAAPQKVLQGKARVGGVASLQRALAYAEQLSSDGAAPLLAATVLPILLYIA